jgi:uracil-DNA glycosylase
MENQTDSTQHIHQDNETWATVLKEEKQKPYFQNILKFIESERSSGKIIYPSNKEIFSALQLTPIDSVKVVILGQDPYHGPKQAHGLCFSVQPGVANPPSLQNIFKEIKSDIDPNYNPQSGCLDRWAKQGVLLLNAVLSVEDNKPASHAGKGWEQFTDKIISILNDKKENLVFMLWGSYAQKKGSVIDRKRHLVLEAPHPSPLSAHRGFLGCKHFSKCNEWLITHNKNPIVW